MDVFLVILAFILTLLAVGITAYAYLLKKWVSIILPLGLTGGLILSTTQMLRQFANLDTEIAIILSLVGMAFSLTVIVLSLRAITIASRR